MSAQATEMLPLESTPICGSRDFPESLEIFKGVEKVALPSAERLKNTSELPREVSTQGTLTLPLESTAICWFCAFPEEFETFFGGEKTTWARVAMADTAKTEIRIAVRAECCETS